MTYNIAEIIPCVSVSHASKMAAPAAAAPADAKKRWWVIYPVYLNAVKTMAEGRRLPRAACVNNPTVREIEEICRALKLPADIEVRAARSARETGHN